MGIFTVGPGLYSAKATEKLKKYIAKYILGSAFGKDNAFAKGIVHRVASKVPPPPPTCEQAAQMEGQFKRGMTSTGISSTTIDSLWRIVESGIAAECDPAAPQYKFWNECFTNLAHQLRCLSLLDPGDKLALWSGGIAISQYARELGYRCLETTAAGDMFNNARLDKVHESLWNLWDYLANEFVDQIRGSEVHIFVRNIDRKSTLVQVEVPHLLQKREDLRIRWHVIVGDTDNPKELLALTKDGEVKRETASQQYWFDTKFDAEIALRAYVIRPSGSAYPERWTTLYSKKDDLHPPPHLTCCPRCHKWTPGNFCPDCKLAKISR